jgi:integrase
MNVSKPLSSPDRPKPIRPTRPARPKPETIDEVCALFWKEKQAQHAMGAYHVTSLDSLRRSLDSFSEFAGDLLVSDALQSDLVEWLTSHTDWKNPHTLQHRAGMIVSAFRWAHKEGLIARCPFYRNARLWPVALPREDLKPEEYTAIMKASRVGPYRCRTHGKSLQTGPRLRRYSMNRQQRGTSRAFRRMMAFLWETGCRVGEAIAMTWGQIDFEKSIVVLIHHKTVRKSGLQRTIAFPPKIKRLLLWMLRHMRRRPQPDDLVFLSGRGNPWTPSLFARNFRFRLKCAGITRKVSPYCCRHAFCVRALEAGISQRQIADVMGQASTRYVSWYGRGAKTNVDYLHGVLDQMNGQTQNDDAS